MSDLNQAAGQNFIVIGSDGRLLLQSLGATITSIQPVDGKQNIIESAFNSSNEELCLTSENVDTNNSNNILLPTTIFQDQVLMGREPIPNYSLLSTTLNNGVMNNAALSFSNNNSNLLIKSPEKNVNFPIIIQNPVLASEANSNTAPLGSQQNPIRIIQQGNNFVPLQNLYPDQLQQIIQAIQEQSKTQEIQQNVIPDQTNIVYNPQTQTKIVYRVVYPAKPKLPTIRKIHPKGKFTKKSEECGTGIELDQFEKANREKRKKFRPRTRYGRVSKPPQYMVKDYKHIHPVDYEDDYNDSDGGYSDFNESTNEEKDGNASPNKKHAREKHEEFASYSGKTRNHKCETCGKAYIGVAGLNRHLKINPSHGIPNYENGGEENGEREAGADKTLSSDLANDISAISDDKDSSNMIDCALECSNVLNADEEDRADYDDDDDNDDNLRNLYSENDNQEESKKPYEVLNRLPGPKAKKSRRGRPPLPESSIQRRQKLLEMVRKSSMNEILDVMIGYLSRDANFKLSKVFMSLIRTKFSLNKKKSIPPKYIFAQYEELSSDVGEYLKNILSVEKPLEEERESIKILNENLVILLDLPRCGEYWIKADEVDKEIPLTEPKSIIKTEPSETNAKSEKAKIKQESYETPRKRLKKYLDYEEAEKDFSCGDILGEVTTEMDDGGNVEFDQQDVSDENCFAGKSGMIASATTFDHSFTDDNYIGEITSNDADIVSTNAYELKKSQDMIDDNCETLMDDNEQGFDNLFDGMIPPEKSRPDELVMQVEDDDLKAFLPTSQHNSFSTETSINGNMFACLTSQNALQQTKYSGTARENIKAMLPVNGSSAVLNSDRNKGEQMIVMEVSSSNVLPINNHANNVNAHISNCINSSDNINKQFEAEIYESVDQSGVSIETVDQTFNMNDVVVLVAEDGSIQIHGDITEQMTIDIVNQCLNKNS